MRRSPTKLEHPANQRSQNPWKCWKIKDFPKFRATYLSDQERFFRFSKRFREIMGWNVHFWHFYCSEKSMYFFSAFSNYSHPFFLKKHRFLVCRFENKRLYFFGAGSTIFERFRSSAFQNTKNYHLTPKTRGDTTICVEPTTPGPHYSRQPRRGNRSSKNRLCKPLKVL